MIVEISASLLGFSVGGHGYTESLEICDEELEGMSEEEKETYIEKQVYNYLMQEFEFGYEIVED